MMKVMNANGMYSHYTNQGCVKHALGELGYLSTMPVSNLTRVKCNCIMNIRHAYGISSADKHYLIKLVKHADYEQAQLGIIKIIDDE